MNEEMECGGRGRREGLAEEREIEKLPIPAFPLLVSTLQYTQGMGGEKAF